MAARVVIMIPIKLWLHLVLINIQIISDKDYQINNWILGKDKNIQDSYIETIVRLFDDADVQILLIIMQQKLDKVIIKQWN